MGKPRDIVRHEERERCLMLVEKYREHLEAALARNMAKYATGQKYAPTFKAIEKVITSLRDIEDEIKYPSRRRSADFSLEEMALAERIIDEQNKNPFEVEP